MKKRVIISGATGFIGKNVTAFLVQQDYEVIVLSRNPAQKSADFGGDVQVIKWDARSSKGWGEWVEGAEAVINLAGENIGSGLWTARKRQAIRDSRIMATRAVVDAVANARRKPLRVIQASAIGYYGCRGDEMLTESAPPGKGFIADVTAEWEQSLDPVRKWNVPIVIIRMGLVLGAGGGLLSRISLPFRSFAGGHFGSGNQWISWIHLSDVQEIILYLLRQPGYQGVFNLTSPQPVTARDFFKSVGRQWHRPSWFHVPAFLLKAILGKMAEETLLCSQRVIPARLLERHYPFRFPQLPSALASIPGNSQPSRRE